MGVNYPFLTSKERDVGTALDYFGARYYASIQGRFTSPDPLLSSGTVEEPQSWNRYSYVLNNPLRLIDPDGLYVFDKSVDPDERKKFNEALARARANLQEIAKTYGADSKEYKKAERALNAYGAEGVKNGVTIFAAQNLGNAAGHVATEGVKGRITPENPTGQNIRVTFAAATFDSAAFDSGIGHEGSHVADATDWVKSGFSDSANPTAYQFEVDGYTVQSLLSEAAAPKGYEYVRLPYFKEPGTNPYLPERVNSWQPGWAGADRATLTAFRNNVDNILSRFKNAGGYGLTSTSTKRAFLKGSRFPR